jgi:hypothetical protein
MGIYAEYQGHTGLVIGKEGNPKGNLLILHPEGWELDKESAERFNVESKFIGEKVYLTGMDTITNNPEKIQKGLIMREAYKKYPVGTTFNNSNIIEPGKPDITIKECSFYFSTNNDLMIRGVNTSINTSTWTIYRKGTWANIIKPSIKVKLGEVVSSVIDSIKDKKLEQEIKEYPATPDECIKPPERPDVEDWRSYFKK